jgi:hypothetical protein
MVTLWSQSGQGGPGQRGTGREGQPPVTSGNAHGGMLQDGVGRSGSNCKIAGVAYAGSNPAPPTDPLMVALTSVRIVPTARPPAR